MKEVWGQYPWMIDVFFDSYRTERNDEVTDWLRENIGKEGSPIHKIDGNWYRGGATIFGWSWVGFKKEETMNKFLETFKEKKDYV